MTEGKTDRPSGAVIAALASAAGTVIGGVVLLLLGWLDDVAGFLLRTAARPITLPLGLQVLLLAVALAALPAYGWWRRRGIEPDELEVLAVFVRRRTHRIDRSDLHAHLRGWSEIRFRRALDRLEGRRFVTFAHALMYYLESGPPPPDVVLTEKGRDFVHENEARLPVAR